MLRLSPILTETLPSLTCFSPFIHITHGTLMAHRVAILDMADRCSGCAATHCMHCSLYCSMEYVELEVEPDRDMILSMPLRCNPKGRSGGLFPSKPNELLLAVLIKRLQNIFHILAFQTLAKHVKHVPSVCLC